MRRAIRFRPYVQATLFPEAELRGVESPTLLLVGDQEVIYDPDSTLTMAARLLPDVEAELVVGVGHLINMERPQFVDQRLLRFLAAHPTSGRTSASS